MRIRLDQYGAADGTARPWRIRQESRLGDTQPFATVETAMLLKDSGPNLDKVGLCVFVLYQPAGSEMAVILVVEDEEQIRVLVESILIDNGHQTLSAAATAQALAVIHTDHPIDLLFTDIRLGADVCGAGLVLAGLELAQQAVELRPELRVLYTSGYGITDGMKSMFVPNSEFLPKPYDINRLTVKIATLTK
jgi:CheY-like chemotaxis protein